MQTIKVENTASTNSALAAMGDSATNGTVITTHTQSAGRGQRGNSWESEPGKNITLSILWRPENVSAPEQFVLSEAVALAVADVVDTVSPIPAKVKWPNDIYVRDSKICGILIENSLDGKRIARCVSGVGLNVNQTEFLSDAPNPVSLAMITGNIHDRDAIEEKLIRQLRLRLAQADDIENRSQLHSEYTSRLWRREGFYLWILPANPTNPFTARIADVALTGHLTLETPDGQRTVYAFKEVKPLLNGLAL